MELKLGWTPQEAERVGLIRKTIRNDSAAARADTSRPGSTQPTPPAVIKPDSAQVNRGWVPQGYHADPLFFIKSRPGFLKLIGLLLTALAISLGAPFWFDLLNKVISIRAAGRSPEEKPKSPEGGPKRIAERAPK
jgi:hypothetical protein